MLNQKHVLQLGKSKQFRPYWMITEADLSQILLNTTHPIIFTFPFQPFSLIIPLLSYYWTIHAVWSKARSFLKFWRHDSFDLQFCSDKAKTLKEIFRNWTSSKKFKLNQKLSSLGYFPFFLKRIEIYNFQLLFLTLKHFV